MQRDWKGELLTKTGYKLLALLRERGLLTVDDAIKELGLIEGFNVDEAMEFWRRHSPDWFQIFQVVSDGKRAYCVVEFTQSAASDLAYMSNIDG